jgi:signal transduction histidine kinase/CheY-like chemotaxis protein
MLKIYNKIRANGCKHIEHTAQIRQVVYLNMIWLFAYITIVINCIAALAIYQSHYTFLLYSTIVVQFFLWIVFLLVYYNKANIAKHLFLLVVYGTTAWHEQFYGNDTNTSLYFFAFLPSAFNIFSIKRHPISVLFYLIVPLFFILFFELDYYKQFPHQITATGISKQMSITNIIMGFVLFILYAAYMIINSGNKQNKLITQSVGLQTTLDNAIGAIWSIDAAYNMLTANKLFKEFAEIELGISDINVQSNLKALFSKTTIPHFIKNHYIRVLGGESIFENFSYKEKDYEIKATPIFEGKVNKIAGATFTCRDITSKVVAEKILLEAKQKAEEASHAKERFLSNMSHELRTPLNGIVGITNIMLDEVYLPEQQKHFETLKNLSDHTLGVVNNILDISKIDAEKTVLSNNRFNLILFVKKLQSIFENTANLKKIDFGIEVNGDADIFLKGDEIKLSQVLINLIGNSIKFTDKGFTKLIITIHENNEDTSFTTLHFAVTDSGIGIHKKHQEKIFESFTQADENTTRKFGGTGLGITISEKILQLMNSKLNVESELGKGSTFSFEVKLKKSSFVPSSKFDLNAIVNYSLPGTRILLAEDNKINQIVAKRFLEKWNMTVTIVENGKEAVNATLVNEYDIILMDLDMPIMDGYEATALIREQDTTIPILALTAASFENMQEYLLKKGFVDVVQKPFMPDEFYKKLSTILQIS